MDDAEIDRIVFGLDLEPEPMDVYARIQAFTEQQGVGSFESEAQLRARMNAVSLNAQAVMTAALGIGGPIKWLSLPLSWTRMEALHRSR